MELAGHLRALYRAARARAHLPHQVPKGLTSRPEAPTWRCLLRPAFGRETGGGRGLLSTRSCHRVANLTPKPDNQNAGLHQPHSIQHVAEHSFPKDHMEQVFEAVVRSVVAMHIALANCNGGHGPRNSRRWVYVGEHIVFVCEVLVSSRIRLLYGVQQSTDQGAYCAPLVETRHCHRGQQGTGAACLSQRPARAEGRECCCASARLDWECPKRSAVAEPRVGWLPGPSRLPLEVCHQPDANRYGRGR